MIDLVNPKSVVDVGCGTGEFLSVVPSRVGDSNMFGWGVEYEQAHLFVLKGCLEDRLNVSVRVVNLGVPGYDSVDELNRFEALGLPLNPDLVVLDYGANDDNPSRTYEEVAGVYAPTAYDRFIRSLPFFEVVSHTVFSSRYIGTKLGWVNPYSSSPELASFGHVRKGIDGIIGLCDENNISLVVNTYWDQSRDDNHDNLVGYLSEEGVLFNDLSQLYELFPDEERMLAKCDGHFTPVVREWVGLQICESVVSGGLLK